MRKIRRLQRQIISKSYLKKKTKDLPAIPQEPHVSRSSSQWECAIRPSIRESSATLPATYAECG